MTENAQRNREAEVNLLAAAREAQWSAAAFMGPNTMKLVSPAKVNPAARHRGAPRGRLPRCRHHHACARAA